MRIQSFGCSINIMCSTQQSCLFPLALAACFILLACSIALGDSPGPSIQPSSDQDTAATTIEHSASDNATIYSFSSKDCTIKWIARNFEIGIIKHWSQCAAPLAEQLPILTKICAEFLSNDKNAQAFRTLYWGRLEPDNQNAPRELSLRLALAAHKSPAWDVKRGKPKNGDINGFVKDLANREMIYPELKELFDRFHKSIIFSSAEKVLVQKAERLPFFGQLKQRGVKAADKLPFDCMTWFSLTAISR